MLPTRTDAYYGLLLLLLVLLLLLLLLQPVAYEPEVRVSEEQQQQQQKLYQCSCCSCWQRGCWECPETGTLSLALNLLASAFLLLLFPAATNCLSCCA